MFHYFVLYDVVLVHNNQLRTQIHLLGLQPKKRKILLNLAPQNTYNNCTDFILPALLLE